jgi:hypothetical protein
LGRLPNGSFVGMIHEVASGMVETSVAGFIRTLKRESVVDFSPGIFRLRQAVLVRRPNDREVSMRYHILEYREEAWLLISLVYFGLWICISMISFVLLKLNGEETKPIESKLMNSFYDSLVVCLRAYISKVCKHIIIILS